MKILINYDYPGNVRELKHIVEHATILSRTNIIKVHDLPDYLIHRHVKTAVPSLLVPLPSIDKSISEKERELLVEALDACRWHRTKSAEALRINRTTLWRKMKKHGLLSTH